ncbi:MAG: SusD/RagB family nutrient-binding outer membrane lipoprotein [Chitinophagaceae bacterium]
MRTSKIYINLILGGFLLMTSCTKRLVDLNENPNGADPSSTNPNLVLSTVLTESGKALVNFGYLDIAGVMQHTQKDGWGGGHNNYDWGGSNDWSGYYGILRNEKFVYDKAVEQDLPLQQGVSLVMKSLMFGMITDIWGNAPYTQALNGADGGGENTFPVYDDQQTIYTGILADLEEANTILSAGSFNSTMGSADVYYAGDVSKWRKFANSLALRYYMRLSNKLPDIARAGIEKIVNDPDKYPIITSASDDATMHFPGNSESDSWPAYAVPQSDSSNYRRIKMCNTLVTKLLAFNDPRITVWANPVQISILLDQTLGGNVSRVVYDTVINGETRNVRIISSGYLASKGLSTDDIDQDPHYVGLPVALNAPQLYNLSPDPSQAAHNPHVSWVNSTFANSKGVPVRIMSAAEVHFILAEASAVYGWNAGDAETHYKNGIKASFDAWGLSTAYNDYINQPELAFDGSQEQIITQKWIASWSMALEAWFDWRRTGYPELHGVENRTKAKELPLRLYYPLEERNLNSTNVNAAEGKLETTQYSAFGDDGSANSPWSKPWVIQGTGKPWE